MDLIRVIYDEAINNIYYILEGYHDRNVKWGFYILDRSGKPVYKANDGDLSSYYDDDLLPRDVKKKLKAKAAKKKKALASKSIAPAKKSIKKVNKK